MLHHMATILVCYGGHFESKMSAKIQKSSDLDEIWLPSRLWCCELISIVGLLWWPFWMQNGGQNTKILRFGRNLVSSRLWWCELISIVGLLWWPFWIQKLISIVGRQIVNGLRFQWKLISRSILKWEIGW
jgi:hypothetical protein